MAVDVSDSGVVRLVDNVLSARLATVRNGGPDAVVISKDPTLAAGSADGFSVADAGVQQVSLSSGEALYAICAAGKSAAVDII